MKNFQPVRAERGVLHVPAREGMSRLLDAWGDIAEAYRHIGWVARRLKYQRRVRRGTAPKRDRR